MLDSVLIFCKGFLYRNQAVFVQVLIFGLVGILATVVHYGVAIGFIEYFSFNLFVANLLAYIIAFNVSFIGHSLFTFRTRLERATLYRFFGVSLAGLLMTQLILFFANMLFPDEHRISVAVAVVLVPMISFVVNKLWVFKNK